MPGSRYRRKEAPHRPFGNPLPRPSPKQGFLSLWAFRLTFPLPHLFPSWTWPGPGLDMLRDLSTSAWRCGKPGLQHPGVRAGVGFSHPSLAASGECLHDQALSREALQRLSGFEWHRVGVIGRIGGVSFDWTGDGERLVLSGYRICLS